MDMQNVATLKLKTLLSMMVEHTCKYTQYVRGDHARNVVFRVMVGWLLMTPLLVVSSVT